MRACPSYDRVIDADILCVGRGNEEEGKKEGMLDEVRTRNKERARSRIRVGRAKEKSTNPGGPFLGTFVLEYAKSLAIGSRRGTSKCGSCPKGSGMIYERSRIFLRNSSRCLLLKEFKQI